MYKLKGTLTESDPNQHVVEIKTAIEVKRQIFEYWVIAKKSGRSI